MMSRLVTSLLQRFSLHDGSGIRTTLFLKGCPLNCPWCQNPETKSPSPELSFNSSLCRYANPNPDSPSPDSDSHSCFGISPPPCFVSCPNESFSTVDTEDHFFLDRSHCGDSCDFECVSECPTSALSSIGQIYSESELSELSDALLRDISFYEKSNGGVTISGGEPLLQLEGLVELIRILKQKEPGIDILIQTAMGVKLSQLHSESQSVLFTELVGLVDEWWVDVKGSGVSLSSWYPEDTIWENIHFLVDVMKEEEGPGRSRRLKIRMPIVPGVNDSEESIAGVSERILGLFDEDHECQNREIELVPLHTMYEPKLRMLETGQVALEGDFESENIEAAMERASLLFQAKGVKASYLKMKKDLSSERLEDDGFLSDRVWRLLEEVRSSEQEICLDRVKLVTEFYRNAENRKLPAQIRRAEMIRHFLLNKTNKIYDGELLVGTFTSKRFSGPLHLDLHGFGFLDDLFVYHRRSLNPIKMTRRDRWEIIKTVPLWLRHNVLVRASGGLRPFMKLAKRMLKARDTIVNEAGGLAHYVPDYRYLLSRGTRQIAEEAQAKREKCLSQGEIEQSHFFESLVIVCTALEEFAECYAREAERVAGLSETSEDRRKELLRISRVCRRVPAHPPETLQEALQFMLFYHIGIMNEALDNSIAAGRMDQLLIDLYRSDLESGVSEEDLVELLACFWIKLNEIRPVMNRRITATHGGQFSAQIVTVGGLTPEGLDGTNELSYILLRIQDLFRTREPNFYARVHADSPSRFLDQISHVLNRASAVPALISDERAIEALLQRGVDEGLARDYVPIGCVEPGSPDCYFSTDSSLSNIPLCLERAMELSPKKDLRDYPNEYPFRSCQSIEDVYDLFENQLSLLVDDVNDLQVLIETGIQKYAPVPLTSLSFPTCMQKGQDVSLGGAKHNGTGHQGVGIPDVANSLVGIDEVVFQQQFCTLEELQQALAADFEGDRYQLIRERLLQAPKYGNDDPVVDRWAKRIMASFAGLFAEKAPNHPRGGDYTTGYYSVTTHVSFGSYVGATPDGRLAGTPFSSGLSNANATDFGGPTAILNSVASLDLPKNALNGINVNLSLSGAYLDDGSLGSSAVRGLIEGHFSSGGMQLQINAHDPSVLIAARKNPELYPTLLVRVSGYSAYFTALDPKVQDEIIERFSTA